MTPIRLLYVGDMSCTTGFGRVNDSLLSRFPQNGWDIHVLGVNATGDPHPAQLRYKVYPAQLGGDAMGIGRFADLVGAIKPDLIVIHNDAWLIKAYLDVLARHPAGALDTPIVGYSPPDGKNQGAARFINRLSLLLAPTAFGIHELRLGGFKRRTAVLPYGVDTETFTPGDRVQARRALGFEAAAESIGIDPKLMLEGFIVGRADRNAPRKRYDLTLQYWTDWWTDAGKPEDAWLYLHCAMKDVGWDLPQLAEYYGIKGRLLVTPDLDPRYLGPDTRLTNIYRSWDVHLSTCVGEGWGLVTHESAACRVPQILPYHSAYAEWMHNAAWFVPCPTTQAHVKGVNTIGAVPDKDAVIKAIDAFYRRVPAVDGYDDLAYRRATERRFSWDVIALEFERLLREVLEQAKEDAA